MISDENELKYTIDTELTLKALKFLPEFLKNRYLLQNKEYREFADVQTITENGRNHLSYKVLGREKNIDVDVRVEAGTPIVVVMRFKDGSVPKSFLDQLYEDLFLTVQLFEEEVRKTTLYLAFMPGEKMVSEAQKTGVPSRVFADSMLPLFIGLMALTFLFFSIFNWYAPLIFVGVSFLLSLFSGKLIARSGSWRITEDKQEIYLLQYILSPDKFKEFSKEYAHRIPEIRKEIYETTIGVNKPIMCETAGGVFANYGIICHQEDFTVKKVNVYQLVKKAADGFGLSIPNIVVTNTVIPNAAAAGPNSKLGTMLITTGILTQLEEDELLSVVGHEMSHLKAHDPLVMSFLSSAEFLLRFYVFWPFLLYFGFVSFWIYFTVAMGFIYFFGKFLESRADLDSAKTIGQPKVLAEALRKIAFIRLFPLYKREPAFRSYRRSEWLQFDPHPPTYFRIAQLEEIKEPERIKHTFLRAVKDNLQGFLRA